MDGDAPRAPLTLNPGDLPSPFVPADCDLRDFPRMMIDIPRLRASAFDATPDDGAWRAAMNLWMSSWHGDPAASLDADDASLCKAAGLGRDLRTWSEVKVAALRGWTLCVDGRLYHATVAEFALEAWLEKLGQRLSSGAGNAKRWKTVFDPEPVKAAIADAANRLRALNPTSRALQKASRHVAAGTVTGGGRESRRDAAAIPSGSQGEGTGNVEVETDVSPSVARGGAQEEGPTDREWREVLDLYGRLVVKGRGSPQIAKSHWLRLSHGDRRALPGAVERYASAKPWGTSGPVGLQRFIGDDIWREFVSSASVTSIVWRGPPDLRAAVVAEAGETFARSYLDPATWVDGARSPTLVALTGAAATRLRTLSALRDVAIQDPILPRKQA